MTSVLLLYAYRESMVGAGATVETAEMVKPGPTPVRTCLDAEEKLGMAAAAEQWETAEQREMVEMEVRAWM